METEYNQFYTPPPAVSPKALSARTDEAVEPDPKSWDLEEIMDLEHQWGILKQKYLCSAALRELEGRCMGLVIWDTNYTNLAGLPVAAL